MFSYAGLDMYVEKVTGRELSFGIESKYVGTDIRTLVYGIVALFLVYAAVMAIAAVLEKYCGYYATENVITVVYNNTEYEAKVSYLGKEMSDIEDEEVETTSKQLYVEAVLTDSSGLYINGAFSIQEKLCVDSNIKVILKSAIHYESDKPYINLWKKTER